MKQPLTVIPIIRFVIAKGTTRFVSFASNGFGRCLRRFRGVFGSGPVQRLGRRAGAHVEGAAGAIDDLMRDGFTSVGTCEAKGVSLPRGRKEG